MKIVYWEEKYRRDETRNVIRKVKEIKSINAFIRQKLRRIDFAEDDVIVTRGNEQIRIPENVFVNLKHGVLNR